MEAIAIAVTPEDLAYVRSSYVTLDDLADGRRESIDQLRAWAGTVLPGPSYSASGELRFARDWWRLFEDAGSIDRVRTMFERRYRAAAAALGHRETDLANEWDAYVAGIYGVCLRDVTPENIVAKARLVDRVERAIAEPHPGDREWCTTLRADVEALDGLARPFATCDRLRFGRPTSRDRLITNTRHAFPLVFAG